jgi:glutaredoxin 3
MPKIEMYTKALCPFCSRAKALLRGKDARFEEYDITMNPALRSEMMDRAPGRSTVPQIFIDGQHIGGCDDLMALDARGGLDPLLIPA